MTQTSVSTTRSAAVAGLLSDAVAIKRVRSRVNAEATAELRFGIMVAAGDSPKKAVKLAANTDILAGIVVFGHAYHKDLEAGDTGLKPKTVMNLLRTGSIWVQYESTAPEEGDEVHVRAVAAGNEVAGAFRAAADGTDTINLTSFAQWTGEVATAPDGTTIAELDIDLTMAGLAVADS